MKVPEYFVFRPTTTRQKLNCIILYWGGSGVPCATAWTPGDSLLLRAHYEISSELLAVECYFQALYHRVILYVVLMINYHNMIQLQ
jgi:hypothetical protein